MVADNETLAKVLSLKGQDCPSEADFKALAIKEHGRIEVPLRDRYAFSEIADHLADLVVKLRGLQQDHRLNNLEASNMAKSYVTMTNLLVKNANLKNRLFTTSGSSG